MNKLSNFKSATNSISLTAAYVRAFEGCERVVRQDEPATVHPPAKPILLDYPPISSQPEYVVEAEKLARFVAQHDKASEKLESLKVQFSHNFKTAERTDEGVISKAESLLAGEVQQNLQGEMHEASRLIEALRDAIDVQRAVVRRVTQELSRAAGRRHSQQHKDLVKRLMAAVVELHAANQAEQTLQYDLVRLGYIGESLPAMLLRSVEDPADSFGNITHYWYREAQAYVKTDAEVAAGVRKARLAAALG